MIKTVTGKRKEIAVLGQIYKYKEKCGDVNQV
jgi:hypothetical protein